MLYLKSYCYSDHEIPFIIANLDESEGYVDKLYLYEFNYTHTGIKKPYYVGDKLHLIPDRLRERLVYKQIDISKEIVESYESGDLIHKINEPLMRSWFYNDCDIILQDTDIIIDIDIDEIMYRSSYPKLIQLIENSNQPYSIRLNQMFFKHTYIWTDCNFASPTIYKYWMVKNPVNVINKKVIKNRRDVNARTNEVMGCHMSWIMPIDYMLKKFHQYSHPEYRKYCQRELLEEAIKNKKYVFDLKRPFNIEELSLNDIRIPKTMQKENLFDYELEYKYVD